jgi:TonB family protein
LPSASADFWSHGFAKEVVSVPPSDVIASPVAAAVRTEEELIANATIQIPFDAEPVRHMAAIRMESESRPDAAGRNSSNQHILAPASIPRPSIPRPSIPLAMSPLISSPPVSSQIPAHSRIASFLFSWWPKPTVRTAAYGAAVPRRSWVLVSLVPALVLLAVLGVYFLRDGVWQPSGIGQTAPMPEVSLGSPIANVVQSPQPKSSASFVVPQLPIAKAENFPGAQIREFADNVRSSRPSGRRGTSEKKIPKEKLLAPYSSANRLASVGRELPPDVSRVDSNTSVSPLQEVLATPQPLGGQAKAPQLIVSSAPIYPTMARQARVEGQVTIEAVIDANGKLTNMTVVSGPALLQQAAIDSLRTWKYQPGYLNEKPVPTKTSITVNFRLR